MPRVPLYEGPQVRPTPLRAEQSIRAPVEAFGGATAQAVQKAGQEFGQTVSLIDKRMVEQAKEDAELAAFNAYTEASQQSRKLLYEGDNAIYNRRGGQAIGVTNEGTVELKRIGEETSGGLTSPYAQQQFTKLWARHQDSEMGAISRHEAGQRREYRDQTTAGVLATSQNMATLRYNDPGEVDEQISIGEIAIRANTKGAPPEQVNAQITAFRSSVRRSVVTRMMVDDPLAADAYFREHAADFVTGDIEATEKALNVKVTQRKAIQNAQTIERDTTVGGPVGNVKTEPGQPPLSRTFSAQVQIESGGSQTNKDGTLKVSPTGNYGITQINDASGQEAAAALGIKWDPALARGTTPEAAAYNLRLGQQYMQMKLDEFGGNETLALAAYHAGAGNVNKWIAEFGDPRTGKISEAAWVAKIPGPATRQYVSNVRSMTNDPTRIDWTEANRKIDEIKDPEEREQTRSQLVQRQADLTRERTERQQTARNKAQDMILAGARFEDIPGEILADMEPTAQTALRNFAESVRKGGDVVTDPDTHAMLNRMAGTDIQGFAKYDLRQHRDKLSTSDMNRFEELQRQYNVAGEKGEAAATGERTRVQIADDILRGADINPNAKAGTADANRVRNFNDALDRQVRAWKLQNEGKPPTSEDIRKMADALVIQGALKGTGYAGFLETEKRVFELTPEEAETFVVKDVTQIPRDSAARMRAAFKKANGGRDPTDAELLADFNEYLQGKLASQ